MNVRASATQKRKKTMRKLMAETTIFEGGKSKDEDDYSLSRWCIE
jgi:hypothetical protein